MELSHTINIRRTNKVEKQIVNATHFPVSLAHLMHLKCSCGYDGPVEVDEDTHDAVDVEEVVECPNCHSKTVHYMHVTDVATTVHEYQDGTKETLTAKKEEVKVNVPVEVVTVADVTKAVLASPIFARLNSFLETQEAKVADVKKPNEGVTT